MQQKEKIENLDDYLSQIRQRPEMYLGNKKLMTLYDNLQGYSMACSLYGITITTDHTLFDQFNSYVTGFYKTSPGENWKGLILKKAGGNEEKAFDLFFELYDSFIKL